jgi:tRNA dimethylallyltransferase
MTPSSNKHVIVIAGPTASGKTALSLDLATHLNAEIFSADARQFYRGMNIGTAKPTAEELSLVKHHFINTHEVTEEYSAGQYALDLNESMKAYFKEKDIAILIGGSGFYIKAAIEGLDDLPGISQEIRSYYNNLFENEGIKALQASLLKLDPDYYHKVDTNNRQRVQRALEAIEMVGLPFSAQQKGEKTTMPWSVKRFWINLDREKLYERINQRVDQMVMAGLVNEVKSLLPYRNHNALQTVGYKEIFDYLDGTCSYETAIEKIKQHTRNYAKRQVTWFKNQGFEYCLEETHIKNLLRHL